MNKIITKINVFFYNLKNFFKNVWRFRENLWNFQDWDNQYNIDFFIKSLIYTRNYIRDHGAEVDSSRLKKVEKMDRLIEINNILKNDIAFDIAEKRLGFSSVDFLSGYISPEDRENNTIYFREVEAIESSLKEEAKEIIFGENGLASWWD